MVELARNSRGVARQGEVAGRDVPGVDDESVDRRAAVLSVIVNAAQYDPSSWPWDRSTADRATELTRAKGNGNLFVDGPEVEPWQYAQQRPEASSPDNLATTVHPAQGVAGIDDQGCMLGDPGPVVE